MLSANLIEAKVYLIFYRKRCWSMSITIKHIAAQANVSAATVSMVINNKPGISPATREKVLNIVQASGYNISPLKSALAKNSGTIQLTIYKKHSQVVSDTAFFQSLIAGIESKASANGYQLTIKTVSSRQLDSDIIRAGWDENAVDGILLLGTEMQREDLLNILKVDTPVLVLDTCFMDIPANYVVIDNISGAFLGVNHLIEHGHRNIGYLKSSICIQNFSERYEGYIKAMHTSNLAHHRDDTIPLHPTIEGAHRDMAAYLATNPDLPTAFLSDNDIIAFGAMKALKETGIRIPQDISLLGFDDMPFCTITEPSLSTIRVNKEILGNFAVENLIRFITSKKSYHSKTLLGVDLVARDSILTI